VLNTKDSGVTYGISLRELGFIIPAIGFVIIATLQLGSVQKQVLINTDILIEHKNKIDSILVHDANTTARLINHEHTIDELKKADNDSHKELKANRAEFPTQFQFKEFKDHIEPSIINKMSRDEFIAWRGQNDRTIELLQRQIEDINRQIAASVLQQQLKYPERPLSLAPSQK
jgi:hypothetical protein